MSADLQAQLRDLIVSNLNEVFATGKKDDSLYRDEHRMFFRFRGRRYRIHGCRVRPDVYLADDDTFLFGDNGYLIWNRCEQSLRAQKEAEEERKFARAAASILAPPSSKRGFKTTFLLIAGAGLLLAAAFSIAIIAGAI